MLDYRGQTSKNEELVSTGGAEYTSRFKIQDSIK